MDRKISEIPSLAAKMYSETEYKRHGNSMYEIGKESAFQSVLKTQVMWSVKMTDDNWDLDTVIIGAVSYTHLTLPTKRIV